MLGYRYKQFHMRSGLSVLDIDFNGLLELCTNTIAENKSVHICTVNPEIAIECIYDKNYKTVVDAADLRTIDGIGISMAILRQFWRFPKRLTGVEITSGLLDYAIKENIDVMIVGSTDEARKRVESLWRDKGVRVRSGSSLQVSRNGDAEDICFDSLKPGGIVFVALGHPKQEFWIRRQISRGVKPYIFIGNGGSIDYIAGTAWYPPKWVRQIGLEWLSRLLMEPKKRVRRQFRALPKFFLKEIL